MIRMAAKQIIATMGVFGFTNGLVTVGALARSALNSGAPRHQRMVCVSKGNDDVQCFDFKGRILDESIPSSMKILLGLALVARSRFSTFANPGMITLAVAIRIVIHDTNCAMYHAAYLILFLCSK